MLRVALTGGIGTGKSVVLAELAVLRRAGRRRRRARPRGARRRDAGGLGGARALRRDRHRPPLVTSTGPASAPSSSRTNGPGGTSKPSCIPPSTGPSRRGCAPRSAAARAVAVAEIPLLFETGHERDFDCVVVTACDGEEQVRRAAGRSGVTEADARRRIAAQWPLAEKIRRADIVVRTDGTIEETRRQARAVWDALRRRATVGYSKD